MCVCVCVCVSVCLSARNTHAVFFVFGDKLEKKNLTLGRVINNYFTSGQNSNRNQGHVSKSFEQGKTGSKWISQRCNSRQEQRDHTTTA